MAAWNPWIAPQLVVRQIEPELYLEAFHTVRVGEIDHPDLSLSFRSHYEEDLAPRFRQTQHAALHMAVSFWRNQEKCWGIANKYFPKHGEYIARVVLPFSHGIDYLDPAAELDPEHLTIWSQPETLARAVVDIVPVRP